MDIKDMAIDVSAANNGIWVDNIPNCGDLKIKSRGIDNADYQALYGQLVRALPRAERQPVLNPAKAREITIECILNCCLLDWDNLSENGTKVPISEAIPRLRDPKYARLVDACIYAANFAADARVADTEDAEKNSQTA